MPIQLFKARLSEKRALGEKYIFFKFELLTPNKIEFTAGQYILLNCPTTPQKRQYSIVSAPRLDHAVELLVELIPGGQASTYYASLNEGDEISFYAPAGEFTISPEVNGAIYPLILIGTGSGLAPLRSIVLDQLRSKETKRHVHLYWGMRYAEELFWLEHFEELTDSFPNFSYHIVLSQAPDGWTLCRGRVTDCLSVHDLVPEAEYYVCGNPQMIEDSTKVLLSRGVDNNRIHYEKFS